MRVARIREIGARALAVAAVVAGAALLAVGARLPAVRAQEVGPQQTGAAVLLRADFDAGAGDVQPDGNAAVEAAGAPVALAGQSLLIRRARAGSYFGGKLGGFSIDGSRGLRVAFVVRADGLDTVTVNLFDAAREDNTTPASPARIAGDGWRPVIFHVEDFHFNAEPPDRKLPGAERFTSVMFHGQERADQARMWIDKLVVYRGRDTRPPDAPGGLTADAGTDGGVELAWLEPGDGTFAVTYSVYRASATGPWVKIAETLATTYVDHPAAPGAFRYRVTAADYDDNVSAPSEAASAPVAAPGREPDPPEPPPAVVRDRLHYADHVREIRDGGRGRVRPGVYLFAGDSITGAAVYTHVLGGWLGRGQTIRQGVASVTTRYGAENIDEYLRTGRPEFAVIMYGTNNRKGGRDVDAAMDDLRAIVDACIASGTVPVLATIPPRGYGGQRDQERFNEAVIALAQERRIPVSYAFEEMMTHDLRQMLYDGVHLTPVAGNEAAGRALRRTMDQVFFALRDDPQLWR